MLKKYLFAGLFLVAFSLPVLSQGAEIRGTVKDFLSGEPLVGVEIYHVETGASVTTDFDGFFEITNVVPGQNSIEISYISYEKKELKQIDVSPGDEISLNINLKKVRQRTNAARTSIVLPVYAEKS